MGKRELNLKKQILIFILSLFIILAIVLFFIGRYTFTNTLKASKLQELKRLSTIIKTYINFNNFDISNREPYSSLHAVRVSVFDKDGNVLYESENDAKEMENHKNRKEVQEAINGGSGTDIRKSSSLHETYLYYAEKENYNNDYYILRLSCPLSEIRIWTKEFLKIYIPSCFLLLIIALTTILISLKHLTRPLAKITNAINEYKKGNFDKKICITSPKEFKEIGLALNDMALSLKSKTNEMEKLERIRKDFVANVSHELKTPITAIKGFSELLESANIDKENYLKFVNIINKNANEMENIIQDLLLLASLENEEFSLETENTNMNELLFDLLSKVNYKKEEKNDEIVLNIDKNIKESVNINKSLITIALANLLINAINYSPPSSTITLSALSYKDTLVFRVKDNGEGIAKEEQEKIFERFYRIDKAHSRKEGGTGLGLSIVKHIAQVHGGSISVKSDGKGKGSTFTLVVREK